MFMSQIRCLKFQHPQLKTPSRIPAKNSLNNSVLILLVIYWLVILCYSKRQVHEHENVAKD